MRRWHRSARWSSRSSARPYEESTIGQYAKTIRTLARHVDERGRRPRPRVGAGFASMTVNPRTGRFSAQRRFDDRRLVAAFDSCARAGRVDLSVRRRGGGGPQPTAGGFAAADAVGSGEAEMDRRGLAPPTRASYGRVARRHLVFLQERGITDFDRADGGSVLAFLESLAVANLRPFLKCHRPPPDLVDAANLAGVNRSHAIICVLVDEDERRVVPAG